MTTFRIIVTVTVPVTLVALVPDIDIAFGTHQKIFHDPLVLAGVVAFPVVFDNLQFVWIEVLIHYVLNLAGALFYPFPRDTTIPSALLYRLVI